MLGVVRVLEARARCGAWQMWECSAVEVAEDVADEVWIGDICNHPQLPAAERAKAGVSQNDMSGALFRTMPSSRIYPRVERGHRTPAGSGWPHITPRFR